MMVADDSGPNSATAFTPRPIAASERLPVLDILRGFALLGMIVVHFIQYFEPFEGARGGGRMGAAVYQAVYWFGVSKFSTTFTILIGVGFAVQLRRAEARGEEIRWRFLRRLLGIAGIGLLACALTGAFELVSYAVSGVWLLVVRRWSTRALLLALLATGTLSGVWQASVGTYHWVTVGAERTNAMPRFAPVPPARRPAQEAVLAYSKWVTTGQEPRPTYLRLAAARLVFYLAPFADLFPYGNWFGNTRGSIMRSLSNGNLMLFLLGLLALRRGVFDRPTDHKRLLVVAMIVGVVGWVVNQFELFRMVWPTEWLIPVGSVAEPVQYYPLFLYRNSGYLALTYIGAITLLVGYSQDWARRLFVVFGDAGRLALTNYLLQFLVLELFGGLRFARSLTPQVGVLYGVLVFTIMAIASRWWLTRFRLGPAEWVLRSLTYARLQPLRRSATRP